MAEQDGPVVVPHSASPAGASRPEVTLETERYLRYEEHPIPWWVLLVWLGFVLFAIMYLARSLGT